MNEIHTLSLVTYDTEVEKGQRQKESNRYTKRNKQT